MRTQKISAPLTTLPFERPETNEISASAGEVLSMPKTLFRFHRTMSGIKALPMFVFLSFLASIGLLGGIEKFRRGGAGDLSTLIDIVMFFIFGILSGYAALMVVWASVNGMEWNFVVSDSKITWSGKRYRQEIDCDKITAIAIRSLDSDAISLFTSDGVSVQVPQDCIGNIGQLSRVLHEHQPHIRVTWNGIPTCEICGGEPKKIIKDCKCFTSTELTLAVTHVFCNQHRRKPLGCRITVDLAEVVLSLTGTCNRDKDKIKDDILLGIYAVEKKAARNSDLSLQAAHAWALDIFGDEYLRGFEEGSLEAETSTSCSPRYLDGVEDGRLCIDAVWFKEGS